MISFTKKYPRKINLGCGFDYQSGYLNIDISAASVADFIQSAVKLNLPHDYFEEILLKDVIEHLGFCKAYFTLADLYLLLKDKGTVKILTPDIEKAFSEYLRQNEPGNKENILCCIYGTEEPGMSHKFCFPYDLLADMLKKSGFIVTSANRTEEILFQPTIQVIAQKNGSARSDMRNSIISAINRHGGIKIEYSDMPCLNKIIEDYLSVKDGTMLRTFIDFYKYVSPKTLLFLLNYKKDSRKTDISGDIKEPLDKLAKQSFWDILATAGNKMDYNSAKDYLQLFIESGKKAGKTNIFRSDFFIKENYNRYLRVVASRVMKTNVCVR